MSIKGNQSPFLGVYRNKDDKLVDLASGQIITKSQIKPNMAPFNGVFLDKDGQEHDLCDYLSGAEGGVPFPSGVLRSKDMTDGDYTVGAQILLRTINTENVNTEFWFTRDIFGGNCCCDSSTLDNDRMYQVMLFTHTDCCCLGQGQTAIPTRVEDIKSIAFIHGWTHGHEPVIVTGVEPFTTVEGFETYKINGHVNTFGMIGWSQQVPVTIDISICLGFRLDREDKAIGYLIPCDPDGSLQSSVHFHMRPPEGVEGSRVVVHLAGIHVDGSNAINTLPVSERFHMKFRNALQKSDRVSATIWVRRRLKPRHWGTFIEFEYSIPIAFYRVGSIFTQRGVTDFIPELGQSLYSEVDIEIADTGILINHADQTHYENWVGTIEYFQSSLTVENIEIISRI